MKKTKLALTTLLIFSILIPISIALAHHNQDPVVIDSYPVVFYDYSVTKPNGLTVVDWEIQFIWLYEGKEIGYAWQYVSGIIDHKGIAKLIGYGTFTSTLVELPGTLDYTIGNNCDMNTNEIWAFRMRIDSGTESFYGIKGTAKADFPYFLMYLNYNPWE